MEQGERSDAPPLADALMDYLDCRCTCFPPISDDDPIIAAYSARRLGFDGASEAEGYVPVLVAVDERRFGSV